MNLNAVRNVRPVQYYNLTEYIRKVTIAAVADRPVMESSSGPLSLHNPTTSLHQPTPSSKRYPTPTQWDGKIPVTPTESRVSMSSGDYLLLWWSAFSFALLLDDAIKNHIDRQRNI
ncbi:hypothetical protein EVAR_29687_1 [Eumeta japonica]|uniref:Uncharacterized protein n=1 Tax=Eumeta variegata TaxID=151549 RepID=A0A4C1VWR9_EUMVA|nr:hypothetical protein EVAR_29687_1 [Eumeta japonica]